MEQFVVGHTGQWWELKEAESISRMPQFNYYPRRLYSVALVGAQLFGSIGNSLTIIWGTRPRAGTD